MNCRICTIALGLLPLALTLTIGCQKQSKEEIIAEYEASKAAQERVDKLQQELDDFKSQAAENAAAQQLKDQQQKVLEKQVQDAKKKAEEAQQLAKATEAGKAPQQPAAAPGGAADDPGRNRPDRGERGDRGGQQGRRVAKTITIPKGTQLSVLLSEELSTEKNSAADSWAGSLANDVTISNEVVWKAGSPVRGIISQSTPTGRLANGEGVLAIRLTEINGVDIDGGIFAVQGDSKGGRNAKVIGTTAALGALVGILSNKKNQADHALGGAAIGAAVGTAVAAGTGSTVIKIPVGTSINFSVPSDEKVTVRN